MLSSRILAVDAGASHVAGAVFAAGPGGRLVLQRFAIERPNPDPTPEADWLGSTAAAFAALAARGRFAGAATLAVPGHLALTKFVKTPAIEKSRRARIVSFEAAHNIPYPLAEVVWDHVVVADDGLDLEVMLMAAKADAMEALCGAAGSAGFPVGRAMPACLALHRAFRFNYPEVGENVLLVDIGARSTHLIFLGPGRFFVRTLALAGNAVTETLADELGLAFAPAEALKIQGLSGEGGRPAGSPARTAVRRAGEIFGDRLRLEIARATLHLHRQTPAALYLTGGGSLTAGLPGLLAEKLKLPVRPYDAFRRVDLSPQAVAAGAKDAAPVLAGLVGLAAPPVTPGEAEATLLPAGLGGARAARRRQPVLLAAAVLGLTALLPPIRHYQRLAVAARADLAEATAQLRPLRALQERNAASLAQLERAQTQAAVLRDLAETKSNWIDFLDDLQGRIAKVGDVWLEKLAVVPPPPPDGNPPAGRGATPPPVRLALSGRLLDTSNLVSRVSAESAGRAKRLLDSFAGSRFVAAVEDERFDNRQPGILRFDCTLVVNPENPL